jgi:hypothetical protein
MEKQRQKWRILLINNTEDVPYKKNDHLVKGGHFFEIENSGILRLSHFPFAFVHQREQK